MFHGRPYGIRAGPTMEEGNSANASQLRSLTVDCIMICFIFIFFKCKDHIYLAIVVTAALYGFCFFTVH